jgi:threonine synthase
LFGLSETNKTITLECNHCQTKVSLKDFKGACPECGEVLLEARYALDEINIPKWLESLKERPDTLWRYHEVLPIYDIDNIISMQEGGTPLIKSQALAASLGLKHLYIKDERQGPTGSFKDRQATVAISALKELDIDEVVVASTGNVAIAYAAYGARAGIHLWAFFPTSRQTTKCAKLPSMVQKSSRPLATMTRPRS